ncbi:MAG: helix-turn-helix transcriptional regulator [Erysipelotrichales bacterium]|nr:helix-turn-helix transcriptional regulator [Erysipelotrichales bacterium]
MMSLEEYINKKQSNKEKSKDFVSFLYDLMDKYNITKTSDIYNKANITKQAFSSIISGKCNPSLNTCVKIAFAMKLDNHDCKYLLKKAGYTLPSSSKYSCIIRYCIENKIYDLYKLNEYLEQYGFVDSLMK